MVMRNQTLCCAPHLQQELAGYKLEKQDGKYIVTDLQQPTKPSHQLPTTCDDWRLFQKVEAGTFSEKM